METIFEGSRIKVELNKNIEEANITFELKQKKGFASWVGFPYDEDLSCEVMFNSDFAFFEVTDGHGREVLDSIAVTRCIENDWFEILIDGELIDELLKSIVVGDESKIKNVCRKIESI